MWRTAHHYLMTALLAALAIAGCGGDSSNSISNNSIAVPADIEGVMNEPRYDGAEWGMRVVDPSNGNVLMDLNSNHQFVVASMRKLFSVGELLDQVGSDHRYNTPVYYRGWIDSSGVLHGNLILVAAGDLTMGGRTNPDGSIAISNDDHNSAGVKGNAVLTKPDPLAGYAAIARQIAKARVTEVAGDVVIDDRLFQPYDFRGEFYIRPIFVNDDLVDLAINPTSPGQPASVTWRPQSTALAIVNNLVTGEPDSNYDLGLEPEFSDCIGTPGCSAEITGNLPVDFVPPVTNKFPLVQTFRIVQPSNYARTVLIEQLEAAGVKVDAPTVEANPVELLPPRDSYLPSQKIAELVGLPYADDAKLILKVSYNIGADTTLLLYGATQGVDNMNAALEAEKTNLAANYRIPSSDYSFVDGSGGGPTTATNVAVIKLLRDMIARPSFPAFFNALPILGVDGALAIVTDFESDPTLAGAAGNVFAKDGTAALSSGSGILLQGQALGGYVNTKSGKRLIFELVVNNVTLGALNDVYRVYQDQGKIAAMLWRDN